MAYDESLAKRIDQLIKNKKAIDPGFSRKEMFGGVAYMLNGNMCIGIHEDELIIRYDPKLDAGITTDKNVRPFDITGRPMKGWALVSSAALKGDGLNKWLGMSLRFVKSLPPKK